MTQMLAPAPQTEMAVTPAEQAPISPEREAYLRRLLDAPTEPYHYANYDYAVDSGLIDMFYYDPVTGQDGLVHTLSGNLISQGDTNVVEGFHHEPSGAYAPLTQAPSYVDTAHLETGKAKDRADYKQHVFEPYKARAFVAGILKTTVQFDPETGTQQIVKTKNGMFPKEYDALSVLQAVKIAKNGRDQTKDTINPRNGMISAEGSAPMIDGETPMRIRMLLDEKSGKIISAFPLVKTNGAMKLTPEMVDQHLYGPSVLTTSKSSKSMV